MVVYSCMTCTNARLYICTHVHKTVNVPGEIKSRRVDAIDVRIFTHNAFIPQCLAKVYLQLQKTDRNVQARTSSWHSNASRAPPEHPRLSHKPGSTLFGLSRTLTQTWSESPPPMYTVPSWRNPGPGVVEILARQQPSVEGGQPTPWVWKLEKSSTSDQNSFPSLTQISCLSYMLSTTPLRLGCCALPKRWRKAIL